MLLKYIFIHLLSASIYWVSSSILGNNGGKKSLPSWNTSLLGWRQINKYIICQTRISFMEKNKASWGTCAGRSIIISCKVLRKDSLMRWHLKEMSHEITRGYNILKNSKCTSWGREMCLYHCGTIWVYLVSQGEESKVRSCRALQGCGLSLWMKWEKLDAFQKSHSDLHVEGDC